MNERMAMTEDEALKRTIRKHRCHLIMQINNLLKNMGGRCTTGHEGEE